MPEILVYSEKDDLALELVSRGRELGAALGMDVAAILLGPGAAGRADACWARGADRVYAAEHPALAEFHAETVAAALYQVVRASAAPVLLVASTRRGKELAPRVAQKLGAGCITDATAVEARDGRLLASRYALGGNTVAREFVDTPHQVIAVLPGTWAAGTQTARTGEAVTVELELPAPRTRVVERRAKAREAINLEEAEVLVCVGRGLAKREDLALVAELAQALGAEMGCTKPLCADYQWLAEDRLVGLSGSKASPRLAISIGISGQIQYAVGIRGARVCVAINKDEHAPIFALSDYGVVGDLYEVVPRLVKQLMHSTGN